MPLHQGAVAYKLDKLIDGAIAPNDLDGPAKIAARERGVAEVDAGFKRV